MPPTDAGARRELILKFLGEYGGCTTRFVCNKVGFIIKGTTERQVVSDLKLLAKNKVVHLYKVTDVSIERHSPFNLISRHAQQVMIAKLRPAP